MNKLETQAIIESTGNYDEEDVEYIMGIYNKLATHIGFEDKRRDKRYVVKFHDVFDYIPEKWNDNEDDLWSVFDMFCSDQIEYVEESIGEHGIDLGSVLTRYTVGSYQAFIVDIPEITEENLADLAMNIYDKLGYRGVRYVDDYIYITNLLQDLEDNYVEYWIEMLEDSEIASEKEIKEMREKYEKERRQAA